MENAETSQNIKEEEERPTMGILEQIVLICTSMPLFVLGFWLLLNRWAFGLLIIGLGCGIIALVVSAPKKRKKNVIKTVHH